MLTNTDNVNTIFNIIGGEDQHAIKHEGLIEKQIFIIYTQNREGHLKLNPEATSEYMKLVNNIRIKMQKIRENLLFYLMEYNKPRPENNRLSQLERDLKKLAGELKDMASNLHGLLTHTAAESQSDNIYQFTKTVYGYV